MSSHYKEVKNGNGTNLTIRDGDIMESAYISVGKNCSDVTIRGCGRVIEFDKWDDLIDAIDTNSAAYVHYDLPVAEEGAYTNRKNEPCYITELSDSVYTEDFLNICLGKQDLADELFEGVDWQQPETLMEDWLRNNECVICKGCGKLVNYGDGCNDKKCPYCGKEVGE